MAPRTSQKSTKLNANTVAGNSQSRASESSSRGKPPLDLNKKAEGLTDIEYALASIDQQDYVIATLQSDVAAAFEGQRRYVDARLEEMSTAVLELHAILKAIKALVCPDTKE